MVFNENLYFIEIGTGPGVKARSVCIGCLCNVCVSRQFNKTLFGMMLRCSAVIMSFVAWITSVMCLNARY